MERSSSLQGVMTASRCCDFCGQVAGDPSRNAILRLLGSDWSVRPVLDERPGAVLMPSIGALVPGHVLVCPTEHARSFAATPAHLEPTLTELETAAARHLSESLGLPMHRFEHGSSRTGSRVACSVEHAHLHLVPAAVDLRHTLRSLADWREIGEGLEALRAAAGDDEYLFYAAPTGERWVATTTTGFPSQMLRRVLAEALDVDEWNWREHPATERIQATAALFGVEVLAGAC
jgi:diadenosine tetraphosphate (Ap4A) HIT family hydrolase